MESPTLFSELGSVKSQPLAYLMAPTTFDEYVGQGHLLAKGKPLRQMIEADQLGSCILWGPPGCGKTSLARLIASKTHAHYESLNAVLSNIAECRKVITESQARQQVGQRTILFIDEIHRFNKSQQDALLPHVESGVVTLIAATTENPYFSIIPPLISRTQVFEFELLHQKDLLVVFQRLCAQSQGKCYNQLSSDCQNFVINQAQGDARKLINMCELLGCVFQSEMSKVTLAECKETLQNKGVSLSQDGHYDLTSALIKSMRGSDPNATVYWLARLLKGGEDPRFIARRLIVFASEDIGNADSQALTLAASLIPICQTIGMPEVQINLAHVATYLARAPKSNTSYKAIKKANAAIDGGLLYSVPNHLKSANYSGARKLGHGDGYLYPHDNLEASKNQSYLPEKVTFYEE